MSTEGREFVVTVPAGTLSTAPQRTKLDMPSRIVRSVRMRMPPGPSGTVGFQLTSGGLQVFPVNAGAWLIGDDEVIEWVPSSTITSGAWQVTAYNTGTYQHSLYFTFYLDPTQPVVALSPGPLASVDSLSGETALPN